MVREYTVTISDGEFSASEIVNVVDGDKVTFTLTYTDANGLAVPAPKALPAKQECSILTVGRKFRLEEVCSASGDSGGEKKKRTGR